MNKFITVIFATLTLLGHGNAFLFAPFYDCFLDNRTNLLAFSEATGQKDFHIAFALGGGPSPCVPTWGAKYPIDDPEILGPIKAVQELGGEIIIATGGALGPYLEHSCTTPETLAEAYLTVLNTVGTTHLDIDIETSVPVDMMNKALAIVQGQRPEITVSFTLMVTGEDYGVTPQLGVDVLINAKSNGVRVDIVNAMAMEYPKISEDFADSVINVGIMTLLQMREIWPEKSVSELKKMLGLTPMIGKNFNGNVFEVRHARKLADWAKLNDIGLIAFWSMERDNGRCDGMQFPSPYCSGTSQQDLEFTKEVQKYASRA